MNSKKILVGAIAATVMNVSLASNPVLALEKQNQARAMTELLDGISVVMAAPECTNKALLESSK